MAEIIDVEQQRLALEAAIKIDVAPARPVVRERQAQRPVLTRPDNQRRLNVAAFPRPTDHAILYLNTAQGARSLFSCQSLLARAIVRDRTELQSGVSKLAKLQHLADGAEKS